jgi:hypothetical protein
VMDEIALCDRADFYLQLTAGRHKHPSELEWGCGVCDFCHITEE